MRLRLASERAQISHWPLTEIRACLKCHKVLNDDVLTRSNMSRYVGGDSSLEIHRGGSAMS